MVAAAQSGGLVVASDLDARRKAGELVRDNLVKPHRRLAAAQEQVIEVLRECRVTGVSCIREAFGGPARYAVTYRKSDCLGLDDGDNPLPYCNLSHRQILDVGSPISICVNYATENIDVSHLGDYSQISRVEPVLEVEVVWYLP